IKGFAITKNDAEWIQIGTFAEYSASGVSWLLVDEDITSLGTLTSCNESRMIILNQTHNAHFRWTCISKMETEVILNISLQFPPPIDNLCAELLVNRIFRNMTLNNHELGRVPFWVSTSPEEGRIFQIGISSGTLLITVGETGSVTQTIHFLLLVIFIRQKC
ncbi:MAG: hypothetical protein ACFFCH_05395, partial [Promethearchaeota archaeon]